MLINQGGVYANIHTGCHINFMAPVSLTKTRKNVIALASLFLFVGIGGLTRLLYYVKYICEKRKLNLVLLFCKQSDTINAITNQTEIHHGKRSKI